MSLEDGELYRSNWWSFPHHPNQLQRLKRKSPKESAKRITERRLPIPIIVACVFRSGVMTCSFMK